METTRDRVDKRIKRIKQDGITYICFQDRYLLEGRQVALSRKGNEMEYFGERITDYGVVPSPFILLDKSITCSKLEELFDCADCYERNSINIRWGKDE